jgi:hypothetical protein
MAIERPAPPAPKGLFPRSVEDERPTAEELVPTAKEQITTLIQDQPDDSTYDEILRELAFHRMVSRGLSDSRRGQVVDDASLRRQVRSWKS